MTSYSIKILAIILMLIDHIGFLLLPEITVLRTIGRLSFPLFAFQIAQGFKHTRSKEKYILRLLIFTAVSQIPYWLFIKTGFPSIEFTLNIGATLTLGALTLYTIEKIPNIILKTLMSTLLVSLTLVIPVEYGWFGVLLIIVFFIFDKNYALFPCSFFILVSAYCIRYNSAFEMPALLALFPILLYNGKPGPKAKYLFYAFYPVHMLVLLLLLPLFP